MPAVIPQILILTAELVAPMGIPTKGAKAEIETHPVTAEAKTSKRSIQFNVVQTFLWLLLINSFWFISSAK